MSYPVLVLVNQFGEESINAVLSSGTTLPGAAPIAAGTVLANLTGSPDVATAVTKQALSNALPPNTAEAALTPLATPVPAITIALSTGNTYTDAAVNSAVNAALVSVVADLQTQLTQLNAIVSALQSG